MAKSNALVGWPEAEKRAVEIRRQELAAGAGPRPGRWVVPTAPVNVTIGKRSFGGVTLVAGMAGLLGIGVLLGRLIGRSRRKDGAKEAAPPDRIRPAGPLELLSIRPGKR